MRDEGGWVNLGHGAGERRSDSRYALHGESESCPDGLDVERDRKGG